MRDPDATAPSSGAPPLADLVRTLRERLLLTQEEAAQRSGVSVGTIRGLEAGRVTRPRSTTLRLLAEALGLTDQERTALVAAARHEPGGAAEIVGGGHTATVPAQLPSSIADFTGREGDIARIEQALLADDARARAVAISTITGRGGVGKTTLATHVAHRLAGIFPDGQLYVNLRGAGTEPVDPARVLSRFLRALGMDESAIPEDIEERAELYRDRIAGRRCLVLLDNAAAESQIRPLLPGTSSCAVMITSRNRLTGLEGARSLVLDVFTPDQATELLTRIVGRERLATEPQAAREIARLCGHLPLAIRVAGARLAGQPHWRLAHLVQRLSDEQRRLDELAVGDHEVGASIRLSYRALADAPRRAFRLLGLLHAPEFAVWVVAALLDITIDEATVIVDDLIAAHLVAIVGTDAAGHARCRLHDLIHLSAREQAFAECPEHERRAALTRVLGASLALAELADGETPRREHAKVQGNAPRWRASDQTADAVVADPVTWFEAERATLVAAVIRACELGLDELAWELAAAMYSLFDRLGLYDDWEHTHTATLVACRQAGNLRGRSVMARNLAALCEQRGRDRLLPCADESIETSRALGDRRLEADALIQWGVLHRHDDPDAGHARIREGLALADHAGYALGSIRGRLWSGIMHRESGEHGAAAQAATGCVKLAREHGYADHELEALRLLGASYGAVGRYDESDEALTQSLRIARQHGNRTDETRVLASMGELYLQCGRSEARATLEQAVALASGIGDTFGESLARRFLGELDVAEHRGDAAHEHLQFALTYSRQVGFAYGEALTLRALGECHAIRGEDDAARSAWNDARRLFAQLGNTTQADTVAERLANLTPVD